MPPQKNTTSCKARVGGKITSDEFLDGAQFNSIHFFFQFNLVQSYLLGHWNVMIQTGHTHIHLQLCVTIIHNK